MDKPNLLDATAEGGATYGRPIMMLLPTSAATVVAPARLACWLTDGWLRESMGGWTGRRNASHMNEPGSVPNAVVGVYDCKVGA